MHIRVTLLNLSSPWRMDNEEPDVVLRNTTVFAQSEELELAGEPIVDLAQLSQLEGINGREGA